MADRQTELRLMLRRLKLPAIAALFEDLALKAAKANLTHEAFLYELVRAECIQRDEHRDRLDDAGRRSRRDHPRQSKPRLSQEECAAPTRLSGKGPGLWSCWRNPRYRLGLPPVPALSFQLIPPVSR